MKDVAIYGFGGLGREIACIIKSINNLKPQWNLVGFFDDKVAKGESNRYGKVLGNLSDLNDYPAELGIILSIGSPDVIMRIVGEITNKNIFYPNIIAPTVTYFDEDTVKYGIGNIITNSCRLSCDVSIGNFNIINGSVSLAHDVHLGDFNVLLPDTRISGQVTIGDCNFMGARSFVYQNLNIGNNVKISAGSFIVKSTKDGCLYAGNPAKKIEVYI